MYSNDSYIAEEFYNRAYDRQEDATENTCTCHRCEGSGKEFYSDCCGEDIINGICTDCKKPCNEDWEVCNMCQGEGEVSE